MVSKDQLFYDNHKFKRLKRVSVMQYGYKERSFVDTLLIYSPLMPKVILAKRSQEAGLFNEDIKKYSKPKLA